MKSVMIIYLLLIINNVAFSHSGRTDAQGGHHNRKSGSYHFHHGMGPHQHPNGVCEYDIFAQKLQKESRSPQNNNTELKWLGIGIVSYSGYRIYKRYKA